MDISLNDLKREYVKFYNAMRKYIWTYDTIECLAKMEEAIFYRFPDLDKVKQCYQELRKKCKDECSKDEELNERFEALWQLLEDSEVTFACAFVNVADNEEQ